MSVLPWLLVGLPATAGLALLVAGRRAEREAAAVGIVVAGVVAVLAALLAATVRGTTSVPFLVVSRLGLRVDGLAALTAMTVGVIALLVLVVALGEISAGRWRFFGLMLVFVAAVMLTVLADDLVGLLAGWEVMGATSYALIAFSWTEPKAVTAGSTALLTTRAADIGLYLAAGAALAGTAGMGGSRLGLSRLSVLPSPWLHVAAAGVLVAAAGKAAQLPFSFWLSGAMRGPSPVSALLHSAAMVAMGGYLLLRLRGLLAAAGWAATTTAWLGAATAVALGAVALLQRDLKQLLAASTSAQLGYVVLAAGLTARGGAVQGGAAQFVAHAATKALLFLAAGVWLHALGTKQLSGLVGAGRRYRLVGAVFTVGAASLAGLPPLSLWASKDAVLAVARGQSLPLYVAGLAGAVLAAGYAGRMIGVVLRPLPVDAEARYDTEAAGTRRVRAVERLPLAVLALAAAALGVLELPAVAGRLGVALGQGDRVSPSWGELALSGGLAVAAVAAAAWRGNRVPSPRWALSWFGLQAAAGAVVVRPVLGLARLLARVDDRLLDPAVAGVATGTRRAARLAARLDDHGVDRAVERIVSGTRRLAEFARRPQTGQVHQYYAQAAVLLGFAVVLLLIVR